jgi:acrylyl-CoA reductase (NADPH)
LARFLSKLQPEAFMTHFKALWIEKGESGQSCRETTLNEEDLMPGEVTLAVSHSTVNYKDGLAVTGKGPVVRRFPMIPGIDFAGQVTASSHADFKPGDSVVSTGAGYAETHFGGYAGMARIRPDHLVHLPQNLSPADAMAIGTAGFTAMQCVMALERHGLAPSHGAAIVTGAAGGVGSVAVAILAKLGWHVIASTGRVSETDYLKRLGAAEVIDRAELSSPGKPLTKERWAAGVDTVGSQTLANVIAATKANGAVAACGLAQGLDLPLTVAPFILRGVALLGINSVDVTRAERLAIWKRLSTDLDLDALRGMTKTIGFGDIPQAAADILAGKVRGRLVVDMAGARTG